MIRLICKQSDAVLQSNTGGPLLETCKTFDIACPELEAWLRKDDLQTTNYVDRAFIGIEVIA